MNVNRNLNLCLNFNGIRFFFSVLITISMNLLDQLAIVNCNLNLRGLAPFRKNLSLGLLFVMS